MRIRRLPEGLILDGRYQVSHFIGAGGFAAVYAGKQLNIERPVAIKVLNLFESEKDADKKRTEAAKQRFIREAKVMASIMHPSVVSVHDFGFIAEPYQPYIVMELLGGHNLQTELQEKGPMDPARALPLFKRCLDALGEGHKKGIIHRDLKPANIFLVEPHSPQEDIRLLDYGIAAIANAGKDSRLTSSGQIIGTYRYLSPEYIRGRTALPALDVYQMALILVEMLTGEPVVEGGNQFSTLMFHIEGRLQIPAPLVECALGPVLLTALSADHNQRFADAYAFREALDTITPESIPAYEEGWEMISVKDAGAKRVAVPSRPQRLITAVGDPGALEVSLTNMTPLPRAPQTEPPAPVNIPGPVTPDAAPIPEDIGTAATMPAMSALEKPSRPPSGDVKLPSPSVEAPAKDAGDALQNRLFIGFVVLGVLGLLGALFWMMQ